MLKLAFLVSPGVVYFVLSIFNINSAIFYTFMTLYLAFLGLVYSAYILIDILKKDCGSLNMQKIAKFITDGSEGYFIAQYGTIFKLSFLFCLGIMGVYYTRPTPQ